MSATFSTKHAVLFAAAFAVGAIILFAARAAWHDPHADRAGSAAQGANRPMVENVATHAQPTGEPTAQPTAHPTAQPTAQPGTATNSICPICGMEVDPAITPAPYKGATVGFGCNACPPQFAADPDRFGPAALQNKRAEK